MPPAPDAPRIHVVHATAPGCHWSWGYEATLNRLRLVYGDQIDLHIRIGCPYERWEQWLDDYGMSEQEAVDWVNGEMREIMGVPLAPVRVGGSPPNVMPASLALLAALHQDERKGRRFGRALVRMYAAEGKDPASRDAIRAAAKEAELDIKRLEADLSDESALRGEYDERAHAGPPVHVGFYNVVVWDGGDRRVILDHAFEPHLVEGAIEYLSAGMLTKHRPIDVAAYLGEHGLAPLSEIGRVFDMDAAEATAALERLEKEGRAERKMLAGAPHWMAA